MEILGYFVNNVTIAWFLDIDKDGYLRPSSGEAEGGHPLRLLFMVDIQEPCNCHITFKNILEFLHHFSEFREFLRIS